jgi:excisionase family DNA binding protein
VTSAPASDVMTMQEVADYLHCHYSTVYRLVRRGELPVFQLRRDYRFRRADIDKWIKQQCEEAVKDAPGRGRRRRIT